MRSIPIICAIWLGLAAEFTTLADQSALAGQHDRLSQSRRNNRAGALNRDYYTHKKYYRHEREPNGHVICDAPDSELPDPRACLSTHYCASSRQVCAAPVDI